MVCYNSEKLTKLAGSKELFTGVRSAREELHESFFIVIFFDFYLFRKLDFWVLK